MTAPIQPPPRKASSPATGAARGAVGGAAVGAGVGLLSGHQLAAAAGGAAAAKVLQATGDPALAEAANHAAGQVTTVGVLVVNTVFGAAVGGLLRWLGKIGRQAAHQNGGGTASRAAGRLL